MSRQNDLPSKSHAQHFTIKQALIDRGATADRAQVQALEIKNAIATGAVTVTQIRETLDLSGWYTYDLCGIEFPDGQYLQASAR